MGYLLHWGCGDSTALFLILPSIPEHILLWRTTHASRRSRKVNPKVTLLQMVAAGHLFPCMAGMIQVNHLEEMWRNKSMLEHSNCIFTWPVLRWRMILHSQFWESLPKCNYHIKDSVPFFFFFFLSFRMRQLSVCLIAHWKSTEATSSNRQKVSIIAYSLLNYLIWGWICHKWCFELEACDFMCESHCVRGMCNSPWPLL